MRCLISSADPLSVQITEMLPVTAVKKEKEDEPPVWKWWEEEPHPDGIRWLTLEHRGPYFAPLYEPLPPEVEFVYDGKVMKLSGKAEEAAGFFAKMLDHNYTTKDLFCSNFSEDWRKEMTAEEAEVITDFSKCDFRQIHLYYKDRSHASRNMTKEQKLVVKREHEKLLDEYGWCMIDGRMEKVGLFKTEPPGLFRGRGDHPKQGRIKKRIEAKDVIINIGREAKVPSPPPGQEWKEVRHDNKVTWLASWTENIQGSIKYIMMANPIANSRLKAEKEWLRYELARELQTRVDWIREQYTEELQSADMNVRQRATAMYFIDKLAQGTDDEEDMGEGVDTIGCCCLRVENTKLHEEMDGKECVIEFDFLSIDSIRYYNCVPVDKQVFRNIHLFMKDKTGGDNLFDRLTTTSLNKYLSELMENLTAEMLRTYNTSKMFQEQLDELTIKQDPVASKLLAYDKASRSVAAFCNHQQENLGISKRNYLDPRISVAWCKKWAVPIEKIYNKTQRYEFAWAMGMVDEDFVF